MLDGKRIAVTGGTRGIGAAIARAAARAGADVAITGRDAEAAECVLAAIAGAGRKAYFISSDFAEPEAAAAAVEEAASALGGLDILVNNAATLRRRDLHSATLEDWRAMLDVNLIAPFFAAKAAAGRMDAGGVIVNIVSEMAQLANPDSILYGVSKAGLVHLGRSLALALAPRGIRVVAIAPGPVRTEMLESSVSQSGAGFDEGMAAYASRIPLKRLASPEEVAETVLFAASDRAAFMTGTVVALDGGTTIPSE